MTEIGFSTLSSQRESVSMRACVCVRACAEARACVSGGVRHVVSTLRSCNKTSAAAANRAEQRGGGWGEAAGREGWRAGGTEGRKSREGGGDGEKSFHDKNCPLTVR